MPSEQIAPSTTIQALCEASGGTSIYCANYQRPLPFSDRSIANFATRLYTFNLNTASTSTEGWDFETNYAWQMADLVERWTGFLDRPFAGDLPAGHQQIGAVPRCALDSRARSQHPHRRFPQLQL